MSIILNDPYHIVKPFALIAFAPKESFLINGVMTLKCGYWKGDTVTEWFALSNSKSESIQQGLSS